MKPLLLSFSVWLVLLSALPPLRPAIAAEQFTNDFSKESVPSMSEKELLELLAAGDKQPKIALQALQTPPEKPSAALLSELRLFDQRLNGGDSPDSRALAERILVVLALSGNERSLDHLHQIFEATPNRRQSVARAIALYSLEHKKRPQDWRILVRSIPILEGPPAGDVLRALQKFRQRSFKSQWRRQLLLLGLRLDEQGGGEASKLLRHWTGRRMDQSGVSVEQRLSAWQKWFDKTYPELPKAALPVDSPKSKYKYAELLKYLQSPQGLNGDWRRGAVVMEKGLCLKCHRFGKQGEAMGPDLTSTPHRFQSKEVLESVLFPSQAITDQYEAHNVVTKDGKSFTGVVTAAGNQLIVLQANGEKISLDRKEIEELAPSKISAMPEGLFDQLSKQEIADLFAFLMRVEMQ